MEVARLKNVAHKGFMGDIIPEKIQEIVVADPWDVDAYKVKKDERLTFLDEEKPIKAPPTLKEAPVALAASGKPMAAVRKPHGGISYNPEFEKWDELLRKEGDKEVQLEKLRIAEREQEARIRALAAEIDEDAVPEEEDSESESEDESSKIKKKMPERKTQAQRNKIKRRKEEERAQKREEQKKKIRQELELIKKLQKQVEAKEKARKEKEEQERLSKPTEGEKEEESNEVRKKKFGKIA